MGEEWGDQGRAEGQMRDGGGGEEQTRGGVGGGVRDYESRAQRMVDLS